MRSISEKGRGGGAKKKRINKEERAAEFLSAVFSISTSLLRESTLPATHAQRHSWAPAAMVTGDISKSVALAAIICLQRACGRVGEGERDEGRGRDDAGTLPRQLLLRWFCYPLLKTNSGGTLQRGQPDLGRRRRREAEKEGGKKSSYRPAGFRREMKNGFLNSGGDLHCAENTDLSCSRYERHIPLTKFWLSFR